MKKLLITGFALIVLSGCTFTIEPHPMKEGMFENLEKNKKPINVINLQKKGKLGLLTAEGDKVDLTKSTESAIHFMKKELEKKKILVDDNSTTAIGISIEKVFMTAGLFPQIICEVQMTIETSDGYNTMLIEQNAGGPSISVCELAITKTVASALNNIVIRNFITTGSSSINSNEEKLTELKMLYDKGLLTDEEYKSKKEEILNSL